MISRKIFASDGSNTRFLSDFIIRSEQFTRVYNYVYDAGGVDGDIDPTTGLFVRVLDAPQSSDLVTIDKWDLVDNSISFYIAPQVGSRVYIEVATTPEEFGSTLIQPSVERAETAAKAAEASAAAAASSEAATAADVIVTNADVVTTNADAAQTALDRVATGADATATALDKIATNADAAATALDKIATNADVVITNADVVTTNADAISTQLRAWEAEAEKMTADSYATEAEDVVVKTYASDGDGTFTATATTEYSALHYNAKASVFDPADYIAKTANSGQEVEVPLYTLTADTAISITGIPSGESAWIIELDANGFTVTWYPSVEWDGDGIEPAWSAGVDLVHFYTTDGGATIKGMQVREGA